MGKLLAAILAMAFSTGFTIAPKTDYLGWLAGHWVHDGREGWAEETWTAPRGGVMLGTGLAGKGDEAKSFEFMRIVDDPKRGLPVFWGSPGGTPPVAFPLVMETYRSEVVFENPEHDYPVRISYRRQGKVLTATISGRGGANPRTWRFRRR